MNSKTQLNSFTRANDWGIKQVQNKQKARLAVCLIFLTQSMIKLMTILWDPTTTRDSRMVLLISLPFSAIMAIIIALEYFLYKKKASGIARCSNIVDGVILVCFMADWIATVLAAFYRMQQADPPVFKLSSISAFASFSWRALFVILFFQNWYWKIIAPVTVALVVPIYTGCLLPENILFLFIRGLGQIFNIIVIIFFENKVKWKLMRTNLEQEKWNQVNNFILDSIPENIMILDLASEGEAKFMSEHCKSFMKKFDFSLVETRGFFKSVQDLKQIAVDPSNQVTSSVLRIDRITTCNGLMTDFNEHEPTSLETLDDIVKDFKEMVIHKKLEERQFLIYNGKLKVAEELKSIEVKISFVRHSENECIILIFRDTTQRDLLIALEQTNKYKDQLLASVSHELRAPLNGNINLVEGAVNSPKIPSSVKEALLIPALRSSQFLLHIINDILDMSQIKEEKLRLVFQPADLIETLKNTVLLVELQAKKKGIDLVLELDVNLSSKSFNTDHIRLSQIVLNLLTNALKFTREGGMVKLIVEPVVQTSWYKISVEDSGIGISSEHLEKLFSNYTHIEFEGRNVINPTGIGLGLNIANRLAEMLGPESDQQGIRVVSALNKGSTFSFIIENKENLLKIQPRFSKENSVSSRNSSEIAEELIGDLQPIVYSKHQRLENSTFLPLEDQSDSFLGVCSCPKVLVVDDNPFNTMALETILSSLEIKCDSVYSGSTAIQKLLDRQNKVCHGKNCQSYSVVFMDQEMPEMNGPEAVLEIKRLQDEGLLPEMKIIGCTAHKTKKEVDKFLEAGLDQCIYKPVSMAMIKDILKEALVN